MFARVENNKLVEWPIHSIRNRLPGTSFPARVTQADLPEGFVVVETAPQPQVDSKHKAVYAKPELVSGKWVQGWSIEPKTREELEAQEAALSNQVTVAVQSRLDLFAQERNYDNILSACTYATSSVPSFAAEGQRCVDLRDLTWAKLYEILEEVKSGVREIPNGYQDIEAELPVLSW